VAIESLHDRLIVGAAAAVLVASAAHRLRMLSRSGAAAGIVAGAIAAAAGWSWVLLLLALFVTGSILSSVGGDARTVQLRPIVEKGGDRDAWQVAANGSVFVASAAARLLFGGNEWFAVGIGALAAAIADTWSTELGTLGGAVPRLIVSGRKVPAGTSGALSLAGTLGGVAGAIFAAAGASLAGWPVPFAAAVVGGLAGAFGDSVIGATIQAKRRCETCGAATERVIHTCGTPTTHSGGLAWLDNDGVNFVSTVIGGLVALLWTALAAA
jgi:uncharacterized protein (TIGR00297 family)